MAPVQLEAPGFAGANEEEEEEKEEEEEEEEWSAMHAAYSESSASNCDEILGSRKIFFLAPKMLRSPDLSQAA